MSIFNNILAWIIFGSVVGSLAYIFEPQLRTRQPVILGVLGAFLTGFLTNLLLNIPLQQFSLISFIVAMCGASFLVISSMTLRNV